MSEKDMSNFDWVRERAECSATKVFERLRLDVKSDVDAIKAVRPTGEPFGFKFLSAANDFVVIREGHRILQRISFTLSNKAIVISDTSGNSLFEVELTLNKDGECRPKIAGQEKEFWQVRQMALEKLFFPDTEF
jgi:hypothetical protein